MNIRQIAISFIVLIISPDKIGKTKSCVHKQEVVLALFMTLVHLSCSSNLIKKT